MIKPLLALIILSSYLFSLELIGKVVKVSDGDTVTILTSDKTQHKIRLNDIDAPEKKQAFGNKSKDKHNEVGFILDVIGTFIDEDKNTGVMRVQTKEGKILKVADLVNDDPVERPKI